MHPTMTMALGREMERERQSERRKIYARTQLLACRSRGTRRARLACLSEAIEAAAEHPVSWFQAIEVLPFQHEPELSERVLAFGRGEDGERRPYLLAAWMAGGPAAPVDDQAVAAWRQDARAHGVHVLGEPLQDPDAARTVRVRDGERLISPGPMTGTEAFIGGLDVISCADRREAIELASAHPWARAHAIEVRPFWSG